MKTGMRFRITSTILLIFMLFIVSNAHAQDIEGFLAIKYGDEPPVVGDDLIDAGWDNVTNSLDVAQLGGSAKFAVNQTHIYALLTVDSSLEWISLEFESEGGMDCMTAGHDGWLIYLYGDTIDAQDVEFAGVIKPPQDVQDDLVVDYVYGDDTVEIEIARALDTGDDTDYIFVNGTAVTFTFANDVDHYASRVAYYIQPYYSDSDGEVPLPEPPVIDTTDWASIKKWTFYGALGFAGIFISTHYFIRDIRRPLDHGCRIVDDEFKPPHITQRWDVFRGREPRVRED